MENLFDHFHAGPELGRALAASVAISFAGAPLGVFLVLRRLSLSGDVYTHTLLPGVAIAFLVAGESMTTMIAGGLVSGLVVAYLSALVARTTMLKEDASLAAFYMISLAVGMVLLAGDHHAGHNHGAEDVNHAEELLHILFGDALAIDEISLLVIASLSTLTLLVLATIWRALIMESYDPVFFVSVGGYGTLIHMAFITLVILNLVIGATALGTIMAIGLMTIPGASARFWSRDLGAMTVIAIVIALSSSVAGLFCSSMTDLPPGPTIILFAGLWYVISIIFGRFGGLIARFTKRPHLES